MWEPKKSEKEAVGWESQRSGGSQPGLVAPALGVVKRTGLAKLEAPCAVRMLGACVIKGAGRL